MMVLRTILFQGCMWIELLLLMVVWLRVQWANHFSPREKRDALVDKIVRNWARRLLFMAGAKVTVTGKENIPEGRTCVFASNHQSFFDILVLLGHLDKPHAILSKASIGKVPLIRLWMKEIHCVYVDRADMKAGIEAINRMIDVINDGYSAIIFPEGTRSKTGEVGEFKGGAFKVAQKTGAPVIPVALDGTAALFERNHFWIKPGKVNVAILPPIETEGMSRAESKELPAKTQQLVAEAKDSFNNN
ncbi:MAG: 1-acyl-sn-glycerol-3-phosphate acyltransferase [Clostridia bacterium]|nr:1-acyl-sn-glycerol-3-phosphate acyltransferase [Clostridia bacterium]